MTGKEPIIYKFTFYGCVHPWCSEGEPDLEGKIEEALCYVDDLQQLTKLEVTEHTIKENPTPKRKTAKRKARK